MILICWMASSWQIKNQITPTHTTAQFGRTSYGSATAYNGLRFQHGQNPCVKHGCARMPRDADRGVANSRHVARHAHQCTELLDFGAVHRCFINFKTFWHKALAQQAPTAIFFNALYRLGDTVVFRSWRQSSNSLIEFPDVLSAIRAARC